MIANMSAKLKHQHLAILIAVGLGVTLCSCSSRSLPAFEPPLRPTPYQRLRTTSYTHTESDHLRYGARSAMGTPLRSGQINSAAADWSRWPAGTVFRVMETGQLFQVDDYGWALSGTNTIDLYSPDRGGMNRWGVRWVNIQILRWGNINESYRILYPRKKHKHVARMVKQIEQRRY